MCTGRRRGGGEEADGIMHRSRVPCPDCRSVPDIDLAGRPIPLQLLPFCFLFFYQLVFCTLKPVANDMHGFSNLRRVLCARQYERL